MKMEKFCVWLILFVALSNGSILRQKREIDTQDSNEISNEVGDEKVVTGNETDQVFDKFGRIKNPLGWQKCGVPPLQPCSTTMPTTSTATKKPEVTTSNPYSIKECIDKCLQSKIVNKPVCGTNGVTYTNPEHLLCASKCGVEVHLNTEGPCGGITIPPTKPSTLTTITTPLLTTTPILTTKPPLPTTTKPLLTTDEKDSLTTTPKLILTTLSPGQLTECIRNCPLTSEYSPLCGTNGITYTNLGSLECAQTCGVDVKLLSQGLCPSKMTTSTFKPIPEDILMEEKDPDTIIAQKPVPITAPGNSINECLQKCFTMSENNHYPVCGTDGVTYNNPVQLLCTTKCGVDVHLESVGACEASTPPSISSTTMSLKDMIWFPDDDCDNCKPRPRPTSSKPVTIPPTTPDDALIPEKDPAVTTKSPEYTTMSVTEQCLRNCPVTSEYDPHCGSDGRVYQNIGRLLCAQQCDIQVQLIARGPCLTTTTSTPDNNTTTEINVVTIPPEVLKECMKGCQITPEYNPVCGSNKVTYRNPGTLYCTRHCGVDVELQRHGRCEMQRTRPQREISYKDDTDTIY